MHASCTHTVREGIVAMESLNESSSEGSGQIENQDSRGIERRETDNLLVHSCYSCLNLTATNDYVAIRLIACCYISVCTAFLYRWCNAIDLYLAYSEKLSSLVNILYFGSHLRLTSSTFCSVFSQKAA